MEWELGWPFYPIYLYGVVTWGGGGGFWETFVKIKKEGVPKMRKRESSLSYYGPEDGKAHNDNAQNVSCLPCFSIPFNQ